MTTKGHYNMKNKLVIALLVANAFIWGVFLPSNAKADDYNTAVIAHVVKETVSGKGVDTSVLEAEMHKLAYNFSLEMTSVLEKHLPAILEGLAAELRMNADSKYKCSMLKDTKIADKECS
tara:strand:+ start:99 stop:458 length:360 start_codon:yes stop_codon:yes gene_type:complete